MDDELQMFQEDAAGEIFKIYLETNPDTDPSNHDLIKSVVTMALAIAGSQFQEVVTMVNKAKLQIPPDVDADSGLYTTFTYTVADSPAHGRILSVSGSHGTGMTQDIFQAHYDTMKHMINNNPKLNIPTKH